MKLYMKKKNKKHTKLYDGVVWKTGKDSEQSTACCTLLQVMKIIHRKRRKMFEKYIDVTSQGCAQNRSYLYV